MLEIEVNLKNFELRFDSGRNTGQPIEGEVGEMSLEGARFLGGKTSAGQEDRRQRSTLTKLREIRCFTEQPNGEG